MELQVDKEMMSFKKLVKFPALRIPEKQISLAIKKFKNLTFDIPQIKSIQPCDKLGYKLFLFDPSYLKENVKIEFPKIVNEFKEENKNIEIEETTVELELNHKNFTITELLKQILPEELHDSAPTSFEAAGHIAHLNLRKVFEEYKKQIAQIIMLKNEKIKTVVNKKGAIDNVFRTFEMELLAGEEKYDVRLWENRCWFEFDFRRVYWNSRLQMEHSRLIELINEQDVVCDMFAGVGPFAVPCARRRNATVYANDLNPSSFHYLQHNKKINKIEDNKLHCYNLDAREFLQKMAKEGVIFTVAIMNLPKTAIEFLDVFRGIFRGMDDNFKQMPTIYCYCFSNAQDPEKDALQRASKYLSFPIDENYPVTVERVRDVAPKKYMLCLQFVLPKEVAFENYDPLISKRKNDLQDQNYSNEKKKRIEEEIN